MWIRRTKGRAEPSMKGTSLPLSSIRQLLTPQASRAASRPSTQFTLHGRQTREQLNGCHQAAQGTVDTPLTCSMALVSVVMLKAQAAGHNPRSRMCERSSTMLK